MLARDATCTQQQHLRALRCIHKAVAAGVVPAAIDTIRACPFTASCLLAHLQRTWAGALAVWQHAAPLRHVGSGVAGGMPDHTVDATHAAVLLLPRLFERARQEMQCMVLALALGQCRRQPDVSRLSAACERYCLLGLMLRHDGACKQLGQGR